MDPREALIVKGSGRAKRRLMSRRETAIAGLLTTLFFVGALVDDFFGRFLLMMLPGRNCRRRSRTPIGRRLSRSSSGAWGASR